MLHIHLQKARAFLHQLRSTAVITHSSGARYSMSRSPRSSPDGTTSMVRLQVKGGLGCGSKSEGTGARRGGLVESPAGRRLGFNLTLHMHPSGQLHQCYREPIPTHKPLDGREKETLECSQRATSPETLPAISLLL